MAVFVLMVLKVKF